MTPSHSDGPLAGRVGIVTGGSSGIGRATAVAMTQAGARIVIADRDKAGAQETVQLAGGADHAYFVSTDVADADSAMAMVAATVQHFGRLDFAHNNAGIASAGPLLADIAPEEWSRCLAVNLTGVWNCLRAEIPAMLETGGGSIVNTASGLGLVAIGRQAAYVAAKHGVVGLTKAAALEYSAQGVRVNAVCPGVVRTPLFEEAAAHDPDLLPAVTSMHPIGRLGQPEEIAAAVVWLCSDASSFVTGHPLAVDGGSVAQ
jgi:NAD(P)-dependent dehydrogenase (short-subunit alcohol dehydrogenase family)